VIKIVPPKEVKFLPKSTDLDKSYIPFCDLIFIIERFIDSKILPKKYEIIYSTKFADSVLPDKAQNNLKQLKSKLTSGDVSINKLSAGFLPKSTKNYLLDYFGTTDNKRYIVDFTNQFFGIKHFHLDSYNRNDDILLFYVALIDKIIFLKIGNHNDLYKQDLVENLILEFPEVIGQLGIAAYPDMPIGEKYKYSTDEIKNTWISGGNVSFLVNKQYFTSCNPQTLSRLNTNVVSIVQNVYYQIEENLKQFISQLNIAPNFVINELEIEPLLYEDNQLFHGCNILIGEKNTKIATEIRIDYLCKLDFLDMMIKNNAL